MTARRLPWDTGVEWRTDLVASDGNFLALDIEFVAQKVLRAPTEGHEDDLIRGYIQAATRFVAHECSEAIWPETHRMLLSAFPSSSSCGVSAPYGSASYNSSPYIEFPVAPVREISSVAYFDGDDEQSLTSSPPDWIFLPAGLRQRARLYPSAGASWPTSTPVRPDAVTITYTVGYERGEQIPQLLRQAIALVAAELYKNPDLSNADGQVANTLALTRFLPRRW